MTADTARTARYRPTQFASAVLLAIVVVALAETAARVFVRSAGRYWQYSTVAVAAKFEKLREEVAAGATPEVLVVGDSTALVGVDPAVLREITGMSAYNFAWAGGFALAFRDCVLPIIEQATVAPKVVVASFLPNAFADVPGTMLHFETPMRSSAACRDIRGDSDLGNRLALRRVMFSWSVVREKIDESVREGRPALTGFEPVAGACRTANCVMGQGPPLLFPGASPHVTPQRFAVLRRLTKWGKDRGFRVVIVVPPRLRRTPYDAEYVALLRELPTGTSVIDYFRPEFLEERHFYNAQHLNSEGARVFSSRLAETIRNVR